MMIYAVRAIEWWKNITFHIEYILFANIFAFASPIFNYQCEIYWPEHFLRQKCIGEPQKSTLVAMDSISEYMDWWN